MSSELAIDSVSAASRRSAPWHYAALAAVTAISLALGLYRLALPSFWFDEAVTWLCTSGDWTSYWLAVVSGEDCGGFVYTLFIKLWSAAFGHGEFALRFPSVLFTLGLVAVLLQIGRELGSLRAGAFMALCGALHPEVICWSRQARAYGLEMFLTALYLWRLLIYARDGRRKQAATTAAVGSLLCLTHIFGAFVVAGGTLFLLTLRCERPAAAGGERVRRSVWPTIVAGVLTAAWVFLMQGRVRRNLATFWIVGSTTDRYWETAQALMPYFPVSALCIGAGLVMLVRRRGAVVERRLLAAVVLVSTCIWLGPAAASALSQGRHHFILARYFLPGVVPIVVVMGRAFAALPRFVAWPAALIVCAVGLDRSDARKLYGDAAYDGGRTRAAVQRLADRFRPGDLIFVTPMHEYTTLAYYGVPSGRVQGAGAYQDRRPLAELLRTAPAGARKWVFVYHCPDTDDLRDLGLQNAPQERFGNLRLTLIEAAKVQTKTSTK